jgi:hypothetical protein
MIHHQTVGDARITGVIEYSGPTHPPDFLYPAVDRAERDAVLKANLSWLAPNHYVPQEGLFTADVMHNAIQIVRPDWTATASGLTRRSHPARRCSSARPSAAR